MNGARDGAAQRGLTYDVLSPDHAGDHARCIRGKPGRQRRVKLAERVACDFISHSMSSVRLATRLAARSRPALRQSTSLLQQQRRPLFGWFGKKASANKLQDPKPVLSQDDLFHPFSKSPFPAVRARGEAIKEIAPCPICASEHAQTQAHTQAQPRSVSFECPDCGWPTHCTEEHWHEDKEHAKYCSRLREANEDEHDLRSGRRLREFELPGE
jgi:splicing suppressor protein 51